VRVALVPPGGVTETTLKLAKQVGVEDIVTSLSADQHDGPVWGFRTLIALRKRIEDAGLRFAVIETLPVSDRVKMAMPGRDEDIENWIASLRNVGAAEIPVVCYNWMAVYGWMRTSLTTRVRGGGMATSYQHDLMSKAPPSEYAPVT